MSIRFSTEEFSKLKELLLIYEWGHRTLLTKLAIVHEDFENFHDDNPIDYIRGRIKAPESIAEKLDRLGFEITAHNAKQHISDIAGVRIICPFTRDIYQLVELMRSMPDIQIRREKDYVMKPKPSGYRSYHLIVEIPVFHSGQTDQVAIEVQIRTEAMNFWATLEHAARYKYEGDIPAHLSDELVVCADKIAELDHRMFLIHENIMGHSDEITAEMLDDKSSKKTQQKTLRTRELRRSYRNFSRILKD
ncbi:MAG: GTP pyrophosphokinase family protein [Defluviitaleaceae bacterium]|nr:GTP pyrophosphokinase family protein [Defluviitaleaceae bacterium]